MNEQTSVSFWDSSVALASDGLAYVTNGFYGLLASWQTLASESQLLLAAVAGLVALWLLITTVRSLKKSRRIRRLTSELQAARASNTSAAPRIVSREVWNQQLAKKGIRHG